MHQQRGFTTTALLIVLVVIFVGAAIYFMSVDKVSETQDSSLSTTPTPSVILSTPTLEDPEWQTYVNSKYDYSIQYPCDQICQSSPPTPYQNAYVEDQIWLPTNTNARVLLFTFTDESVKDWNDNLGPGTPFPFSLSSAREALELPTNSSCSVSSYYDGQDYNCLVVTINGEKSLRFLDGLGRIGYPNRNYLINRGGNKWLEISEVYDVYDYEPDFLADESSATPEQRSQVEAISEVVKTLQL